MSSGVCSREIKWSTGELWGDGDVLCLLLLAIPGFKSRASHTLGKRFIIYLHSQPVFTCFSEIKVLLNCLGWPPTRSVVQVGLELVNFLSLPSSWNYRPTLPGCGGVGLFKAKLLLIS